MRKILALCIISLMLGCPGNTSTINPILVPQPIEPTDTDWCEPGCKHLLTLVDETDGQLGCREARVLEMPNGEIVTCTQFCKETQENGRSLCPSKWSEVKKCSELESVRLTCGSDAK